MNTLVDDRRIVQLYRELLATNSLSSFVRHNSAVRQQMFSAQHMSQILVIKGSSEKYIQTGMEREYAKYTFSKKFNEKVEIIKVIERYPKTLDFESISMNPETFVIYENFDTKEVGVMNLTTFCTNHQYFGFEYKHKQAIKQIKQGALISEGTIVSDSPSVTDDGGYKYGKQVNVAFMTIPGVAEDGIAICEDILDDFSIKTYEHRVVEFGGKRFPRNLYGTLENYKPFPDIGERIRGDGLLAALCKYEEYTSVVEMNRRDSMIPDTIFDKLIYAGGPGGRVVDIRIHHDPFSNQARTPEGMDKYLEKYENARRRCYREILDVYNKLYKLRGEHLRISREFQRLLVEAIAVLDENKKQKIEKLYRLNPIDDWRIEFVIEYELKPNIGYKMTDVAGGKGVLVKTLPRSHMPVDDDGNSADIVADPNATISRMNIGRCYEHYFNACSRDIRKRIRQQLGLVENQKISVEELASFSKKMVMDIWEYLKGFYQIISPLRMYENFALKINEQQIYEHLTYCINEWIIIYFPPENETEDIEVVKQLEEYVKPTWTEVSYIGNSGKLNRTKEKVRIAPMYYLLLEKTGDDWTAVPSARLQNYGVLSQITNADKFSQPTRQQAIRAFGESEVRILRSNTPAQATAEIMDRNNNPDAHAQIVENILTAEDPMNIEVAVNREEIPINGSKPLKLFKHYAYCSGFRLASGPHDPFKNIFGK